MEPISFFEAKKRGVQNLELTCPGCKRVDKVSMEFIEKNFDSTGQLTVVCECRHIQKWNLMCIHV